VEQNQPSQTWRDAAGDVVSSFVDAVNGFDENSLIDLFAEDAHVNDQLRDFWGKAAIGHWIRREIVGEHFTMEVLHAKEHYGELILTAKVAGDFDRTGLPDPMILSFLFSLCDEKIARLIILLTRPEDTAPDVRKAHL
jgi:hypothetical protein